MVQAECVKTPQDVKQLKLWKFYLNIQRNNLLLKMMSSKQSNFIVHFNIPEYFIVNIFSHSHSWIIFLWFFFYFYIYELLFLVIFLLILVHFDTKGLEYFQFFSQLSVLIGDHLRKFTISNFQILGWGSKYWTTKCRTIDISKIQNCEY